MSNIFSTLSNYHKIQYAKDFTFFMHNNMMKQRRKYTNEPYSVHLHEVANNINTYAASIEGDWLCEIYKTNIDIYVNIMCAAYLHDIIEDTYVDQDFICKMFNEPISILVSEVTNNSSLLCAIDKNTLTRKQRLELDLQKYDKMITGAKLIKLADILHNVSNIKQCDPKFAKIYFKEKKEFLKKLTGINDTMYTKIENIIYDKSLEIPSELKINRIMTIDCYRDGGSNRLYFIGNNNKKYNIFFKYYIGSGFVLPVLYNENKNETMSLNWNQAKELFNNNYTIDKEDGWHGKEKYVKHILKVINKEIKNEN